MDAWPFLRIHRESLVITPYFCAWNCWGACAQMGSVDQRYSNFASDDHSFCARILADDSFHPHIIHTCLPMTVFWVGILAWSIYEACALSARIAPKIRTLHQRAAAPCLFLSNFSFGSRISWHHMPKIAEHLLILSARSLSQRRTTHTLFVCMIPRCHLRSFKSVLCTMYMVWVYLGLKGWGRTSPNQGEKA